MKLPPWVNNYIGIEFEVKGRTFEGCDCWGLASLILLKEYAIDVSSCESPYQNLDNHIHLENIIEEGKVDWKQVNTPKEGDLILLRVNGYPMHMGIVLGNNYFIHIMKGMNSVIEKYNGRTWEKRISGFFRYKGSV